MTASDAGDGPNPEQREREALIEDIKETREELGATVEALAQKADVKAQVHEKVDEGRQRLHRRQDELLATVRDAVRKPAVQAAMAAVAGLLVLRSRRRRHR
jgi:predicted transcriptional regulator